MISKFAVSNERKSGWYLRGFLKNVSHAVRHSTNVSYYLLLATLDPTAGKHRMVLRMSHIHKDESHP